MKECGGSETSSFRPVLHFRSQGLTCIDDFSTVKVHHYLYKPTRIKEEREKVILLWGLVLLEAGSLCEIKPGQTQYIN